MVIALPKTNKSHLPGGRAPKKKLIWTNPIVFHHMLYMLVSVKVNGYIWSDTLQSNQIPYTPDV